MTYQSSLCSNNSLFISVWCNLSVYFMCQTWSVNESILESWSPNIPWTRLNNIDDEILSTLSYRITGSSFITYWLLLHCKSYLFYLTVKNLSETKIHPDNERMKLLGESCCGKEHCFAKALGLIAAAWHLAGTLSREEGGGVASGRLGLAFPHAFGAKPECYGMVLSQSYGMSIRGLVWGNEEYPH